MRDVVVKPARSVLIRELPVELICKCGQQSDLHPTENCKQFKGDRVRSKT